MASRIAGITVEIGGDTKKLTSALSGVNKQISSTQNALKDVDKLLKLDPSNTELLSQKQKLLQEAIAGTKDKLAALQDAAAGSDLGADEHDALQREIIETQQKLEALEGEYKNFGSVAQQQIKAAGEKMQEVGGKISQVGEKMQSVGADLSKKVTAPIVAVGTTAVAAFNDVDVGYDTIIGKTGATGDALEDLKGQFNDIYSTMNATSEEVGAAIGEVNTRFHQQGEECGETSKQFLKYAKLNNTDVSGSIDTVQNALAAFNMEAENAPTLLDVLNRTGQNTGASVDSMAASLVSNATALQELGLDIYESVGFLGQLEMAGAENESVISGMKRALKSATEEGKPFNEALMQLQDTILNGTGSVDGLTMAYDLYGKSGSAVYQAVKNGQLDFSNLASSADILADSVGSVSSTYEATLDPTDRFKVALNNLKLTGAELGATVLETLTPAIQTVSNAVQKAREWWEGLSESQQQMIVKIALVVAAIGPVVAIIGTVVSGIGSVISVAGTLMSAMGALLSPIGLVVAAIAGMVAIGVTLYKHWDELKAWASEKWSNIKETVSGAWESIKGKTAEAAANVKEKISSAWENVKSKTSAAWTNVRTKISTEVETAKTKVSTAWESVKSKTSAAWENVKSKTSTAWSNVRSSVSTAAENAKAKMSGAWDSIKSKTSTAWENIKSAVSGKVSGISSSMQEKLSAAKSTVTGIFEGIKSAIGSKLDSARETVRGAIEKIKGFFNFSWSLPSIKLPHFSIQGKFSLSPPSIPHISVSWYKKAMDNAMVLDDATIFGMAGGKMLGGGEAGREVISGESHLLGLINGAVDSAVGRKMDSVLGLLERYLPECSSTKVAFPVESFDQAMAGFTARRAGAW